MRRGVEDNCDLDFLTKHTYHQTVGVANSVFAIAGLKSVTPTLSALKVTLKLNFGWWQVCRRAKCWHFSWSKLQTLKLSKKMIQGQQIEMLTLKDTLWSNYIFCQKNSTFFGMKNSQNSLYLLHHTIRKVNFLSKNSTLVFSRKLSIFWAWQTRENVVV